MYVNLCEGARYSFKIEAYHYLKGYENAGIIPVSACVRIPHQGYLDVR